MSFTVLAANTDWYSGTIYGDGGHSWWGTAQRRGVNAKDSTLYKYVNMGGADSVTKNGELLKKEITTSRISLTMGLKTAGTYTAQELGFTKIVGVESLTDSDSYSDVVAYIQNISESSVTFGIANATSSNKYASATAIILGE